MRAACPVALRRPAVVGLLVTFGMLVANDGPLQGDPPAQATKKTMLRGLAETVRVFFDSYGVPHIFAGSWSDACRILGYLHATDRLGQMDLYRRQASGTMAEVRGKDALNDDILVRRLGIRRSCEALWQSGELPAEMRKELEAYADGVNQRIAELGDETLPLVFKALGYKPAPWSPVDTLVFSKYMGWDQSGTDDDLWFGMVAEKFGAATFEQLWPLDRPYEIPTIAAQSDRAKVTHAPLRIIPGASTAYARALATLNWKRWLGDGPSFGSNNWAVDGTKTASGKPMLCSDPHLGFRLPAIWYTAHLSVGGKDVAGVTFPGGPSVIIGFTDHHAWGLTNMQADAVDYFVETLHPSDPMQYKHLGQWKTMTRVTEKIPVKGQAPHELNIDETVHGPIISREGRAIAMQWTGLGPTRDPEAIWRMNRATSLKEFLAALDKLEVPALNVCYADVEGNIAMHPCGRLPLRLPGQGRIPMGGASGENDWKGWIPRNELPLEINPARHFVASANNRPTPVGYPHYVGWMWDASYRIRRIHELLHPAQDLTINKMAPIQNDAYDKGAERFVPILLNACRKSPSQDSFTRQVLEALAAWNYVADQDAIGPAIWMRWLECYREAIWQNKWKSRGVPTKGGNWGFSDMNRRDPEIEVLEYLTREQPKSPWFDDEATAQHEDRDVVLVHSFARAVASLRKQFGDDLEKWRWKHINQLQISSLLGEKALGRSGGPVPGTGYTINPGSDIGAVSGGASWRMIVDFGDVANQSVGVYPGGQSEDPASPHYSDQMALWAKGHYLKLNALSDPAKLPKDAAVRSIIFEPAK
jgi:penicillin G amidase